MLSELSFPGLFRVTHTPHMRVRNGIAGFFCSFGAVRVGARNLPVRQRGQGRRTKTRTPERGSGTYYRVSF